ncbi:hypothetical protein V8G54_037333 [Vigna mungo]|uniref:WAT1-related protein n=1 Tax=Vigna mungo TaxID=3915 RepID=A0AAQ3MIW1_VIGMU
MEELCGAKVGNMVNKAKPYVLTVGLQFGMAGTYLFTMASLNHGMSRFVFIVYRNAIAALALAPFALIFERKVRPKMTWTVFLQILVLGFLEPVVDQGFTFLGMQYTSASFASAVMNAVPSVTFVLALFLRLERVNMRELRSQAKVVGTLVTFAGALLMTLYKGPQFDLFHHSNTTHQQSGSNSTQNNHSHWSITVKRYPAELSLSSLICLGGALQSAVVAVIADHNPRAWAIGFDYTLYGPLYTGIISFFFFYNLLQGIMSSGIAYYIQGLVMQSRGPVFVTSFNPLCMIIVTALGSLLLGEHLYLGSIIGGMIIAVGLYSVVWGKGKDYGDEASSSPARTKETERMQLPVTSPNNK